MQGCMRVLSRFRRGPARFTLPSLVTLFWALIAAAPAADAPVATSDSTGGSASVDSSAAELTPEVLEGRIKLIRDDKDLDESLRDELVETYSEAVQRLRAANEFAAKAHT